MARQEDRVCRVCCCWGHFSHPCRDARFHHRKAPPTGELCKAQTPQGCPAPAPFVYLSQLLTFVGHIIFGSGIFRSSCCQCNSSFQMVISCAPIQPHPASQAQGCLLHTPWKPVSFFHSFPLTQTSPLHSNRLLEERVCVCVCFLCPLTCATVTSSKPYLITSGALFLSPSPCGSRPPPFRNFSYGILLHHIVPREPSAAPVSPAV